MVSILTAFYQVRIGLVELSVVLGLGVDPVKPTTPLGPGAAPTGEQGCVYTYGKASFVKLDDVAPRRHFSDFFQEKAA